jgi:hypothetical protein
MSVNSLFLYFFGVCRAFPLAGRFSLLSSFHLYAARPTFTIKLPRSTQRLVRGSMLMLHCLADAWPEATLRWTHNDTVLAEIDDARVQILNNNSLKYVNRAKISRRNDLSLVRIEPIRVTDTGRYACSAENALGKAATACDVIVYEGTSSID